MIQSSKKIRIAFVYMPCAGLTKNYFFTTSYHFFMIALKRNPDIDVSYFPSEKSFDAMKLKGKFDVILLFEDKLTPCSIEKLVDIKKTGMPVVVRTGDLQETKHFDIISAECARSIQGLTLELDIPVMFGVLTTEDTKQALERALKKDKGYEVMSGAFKMINTFKGIRKSS